MPLKNHVKKLLADELEAMLEEMPLEKIRVTSLVKRCGTSSQTFYYHFQDKYELVAWMFFQDFISIYTNRTSGFSPQIMAELLSIMESHKDFYRKAFEDRAQNAIEDYVFNFNITIVCRALMSYFNRNYLTKEEHFDVVFHSHGVTGLFKDWLFGPFQYDIKDLADYQYQKTPDYIKKAYALFDFESLDFLN